LLFGEAYLVVAMEIAALARTPAGRKSQPARNGCTRSKFDGYRMAARMVEAAAKPASVRVKIRALSKLKTAASP
jgi:hypothetical protein